MRTSDTRGKGKRSEDRGHGLDSLQSKLWNGNDMRGASLVCVERGRSQDGTEDGSELRSRLNKGLSANTDTRSIVLEREHVFLDHLTLSTPELEHLTGSIRKICVERG